MKPNAFVFFDLDGTLLNKQSKLSPRVKEAVKELHQKGAIPFIATGRSPIEIHPIAKEANIQSFVSMNGQYVQYEGEVLYKSVLDSAKVARLKRVADERGFPLSFYSTTHIRATKHNETLEKAFRYIGEHPAKVDPTFYKNQEILMALLVNEDGTHDESFIQHFPEFSFYRNDPYSMDVISKGHSKATGIDKVVQKIGFANIPIYAFGDGANDLEMFDHATYTCAMKNGIEEIRRKADYVTGTNAQDGMVEGLRYFHLID